MIDFLTFKSFISIDVLIIFYYIGAIVIPYFLYKLKNYLLKKFGYLKSFSLLNKKQKRDFKIILFIIFIFLEICYRMMFEMMIGFFQMRDYLQIISA